ncbi:MAG: TetR/AcrR family transcriptional regulator [Chloroflexota bacterium]|nr:TetR/AcrR family transcriptional regulator [Chloroflexota bacterium]
MPRVTAAHEREVRERIVRAAVGVFDEKGYHRSTMQDIVRASGLSVGAIYTYFGGKDELFLAACVLSMDQGFGELGDRLARGGTVADKLAIAVAFFIDTIDPVDPRTPGSATYLIQAWAEAGQSATVREMLVRRREQIGAVGQMLLREGVVAGELPAWLDIEAAALAYSALLDGLLLQRIERSDGWRRGDAERRAFAVLELLLASSAAAERPAIDRPRPKPFSLIAHGSSSADLAS